MATRQRQHLITKQEATVFAYFVNSKDWAAVDEIATTTGVGLRTAGRHVKRLFDSGMLDRAKTFPAPKYKIKDEIPSSKHLDRLTEARLVFGV